MITSLLMFVSVLVLAGIELMHDAMFSICDQNTVDNTGLFS